jgi:hypothetical protein
MVYILWDITRSKFFYIKQGSIIGPSAIKMAIARCRPSLAIEKRGGPYILIAGKPVVDPFMGKSKAPSWHVNERAKNVVEKETPKL